MDEAKGTPMNVYTVYPSSVLSVTSRLFLCLCLPALLLWIGGRLSSYGVGFALPPPGEWGDPPLPRYHLWLQGQDQGEQALSEQRPLVLDPDRVLTLVLRPETAVAGAVEAHAILQREDPPFQAPVSLSRAPGGAFSLVTRARNLGRGPGRWSLVLRIDRPGLLSHVSLLNRPNGGQSFRVPIRLVHS
jgi:hypothetical protein